MILGAVLAGGKSSRFGSDKGLARLDGQSLLELAVRRLAFLCDKVAVVGRRTGHSLSLADWPGPGMGPLGGLAAALHYAEAQGFSAVISSGVDTLGLPDDLLQRLSPAPAFVAGQPVVGLWPTGASGTLDQLLLSDAKHSMLAFAHSVKARAVTLEGALANINTPEDLARLREDHDRK